MLSSRNLVIVSGDSFTFNGCRDIRKIVSQIETKFNSTGIISWENPYEAKVAVNIWKVC